MRISVIGTGYVGLVTGTCFAEVGNHVLCLDLDEKKIQGLREGIIPIFEPGLDAMVERNYKKERLLFTTQVAESVAYGKIQFIAVGTPPSEDGSADLQYVIAAARSIGRHMTEPKIIVNKSTVPVGTGDLVRKVVAEELAMRDLKLDFHVVSNPEFLKEGAAIDDFMKPDRVIVGAESDRAFEVMRSLYSPFQKNHDRVLEMDIRSAELTKYAANAMLATRISFMNELARLAEIFKADIEHIRKGIGSDPRIGYSFLYPGVGYGGSCFPKDVKALVKMGSENEMSLSILNAVEQVNSGQHQFFLEKILDRFSNDLEGKKIAVWGLAFKPNTDDMREAPSVKIIQGLVARGASIWAYDPVAQSEAKVALAGVKNVNFMDSAMATIDRADALVVVTEWIEFRSLEFEDLDKKMRQKIIFDGRNIYDPNEVRKNGFEYFGVGRMI